MMPLPIGVAVAIESLRPVGVSRTMIEKLRDAVVAQSSVTRIVKLKVPPVVGVPESSPVEALSVTPGGSVPAVTVKT